MSGIKTIRLDLTTAPDLETELNDLGNAERFCQSIGSSAEVRYIQGRGWFRWRGSRYEAADDWVRIRAGQEVKRYFTIAADIPDEKHRNILIRHANASLRAERLRAMVDLAAAMPGIKMPARMCDVDPNLLGVENGVVDLRKSNFSDWSGWRSRLGRRCVSQTVLWSILRI